MNSMKRTYATGEEWRNISRKNKEAEPKQKQCPVVDVTGDGSRVQCCKEQYCIGTWNVRSMNQDKLGSSQTGDGKSERQHSRFLCNIVLYSIGPCFYHQSHPQLGVVFAFAPSLHSFWSYFSTDLQ